MGASKTGKKYSHDLGPQIKQIRIAKGLKVIDIARRTGLTSSTISQVERSKISPTIATLKKIAQALDHPLGFFFESQPEKRPHPVMKQSPVVHKHQRKILSPCKGITQQLLNPDMSGPIEFIYNIYEPGASTGPDQYNHPGSECGLVLEGELIVTVDEDEYHLKEGDSITFSSTEPHSLYNPGKVQCIALWVNTPPWF